MKIVVIGQGAIGLFWYYHLSKITANRVTLLCSKSIKSTPENITYISDANKLTHQILNQATEQDLANAELIIFCLKAYQLPSAFKQYLSNTTASISLILCHNGMLSADDLPTQHTVLTMLISHGAKKTADFVVQHTGLGNIDLGLTQGELSLASQAKIMKQLSLSLSVKWQDNINIKQWIKLAVNCVINPLTAIHDCDNGDIADDKYAVIRNDVIDEVCQVAKLQGVFLEVKEINKTVVNVALNTAKNCSSMRSDILAHRKTEIDNINGFIHQQGLRLHVTTPINTNLWQEITLLEKSY